MLMPEVRMGLLKRCHIRSLDVFPDMPADSFFFSSVGSARVIHLVALHELHLSHRQQSQLRWTLEEHHGGNAQQEPHDLLHHGHVVQLVRGTADPSGARHLFRRTPCTGPATVAKPAGASTPEPPLLPPPPASSLMRHLRRCRWAAGEIRQKRPHAGRFREEQRHPSHARRDGYKARPPSRQRWWWW